MNVGIPIYVVFVYKNGSELYAVNKVERQFKKLSEAVCCEAIILIYFFYSKLQAATLPLTYIILLFKIENTMLTDEICNVHK